MRRGIAAVVIIAILIIGGFLIFGRGNNSTNNNQQPASSNTSSQNPIATSSVSIKNMAFSPASISVKKGDKVTWTNNDNIAHTVTADSGNGPGSQALQPGQSYSFTYNQAGTFAYHCSIHPEMHGTVKVTDASAAAPANNSNTSSTTPASNSNTNTGTGTPSYPY